MSDDEEVLVCSVCGEPIGEKGEARQVRTRKPLNPDGTEQLGHPVEINWVSFCAKHLAEFDAQQR